MLDADVVVNPQAAVGDLLVGAFDQEPEYRYWLGEGTILPAPGRPTLIDETGWRLGEANAGLWGDGEFALVDHADAADGATWVLVHRRRRKNPHFCYESVATCQVAEVGLLWSDSGENWAEAPLLDMEVGARWLTVSDNGDIGLIRNDWRTADNAARLLVDLHVGPEPPATHVPEHYDPPDPPVEFWDGGEFGVGDEARYAWGLGGNPRPVVAGSRGRHQRWTVELCVRADATSVVRHHRVQPRGSRGGLDAASGRA